MSRSLTFILIISPKTEDSEINQFFTSFNTGIGNCEAKSPHHLDSDAAEPVCDVVADFLHAVVPVDVLEDIEGYVLYVEFES